MKKSVNKEHFKRKWWACNSCGSKARGRCKFKPFTHRSKHLCKGYQPLPLFKLPLKDFARIL